MTKKHDAKRQAKAAERVERRAEKVARAEARLLSLSSQVDVAETSANGALSPDGTVRRLEALEEHLADGRSSVLLPEGSEKPSRSKGRHADSAENPTLS